MATAKVSMQGIGATYVTMLLGSDVCAGYPCVMEGNNKVKISGDGGVFCGVITEIRAGLATVQLTGFVTLPYSGETAPSVGYCALAGDGDGGVKVATGGRSRLVTEVDTTAQTVGLFL